MDTYLCALLFSISQINTFFEILSPIIFFILRIFKIYKYEITQNENIKFLQTRIEYEFCLKYNDDNKPIGWVIGFNKFYIPKYICNIGNRYENDSRIIILITTKKQRDILLNKKATIIINNHKSTDIKNINSKKDNKFNNNDITLYKRNNYYLNIGYCKKKINIGDNIPTNSQKLIINEIITLFKQKNRIVCYLYGKFGQGKTFLTYLLANQLKCSLCKTFNPTDPGDELSELYAIIQPTEDNPLIVLLDEVDIMINAIHNQNIIPHKNIAREVYNKTTWNIFLDNIDFGHFPHLILIMCSNKTPKEINQLDTSYMRKNRVHYMKEVINKDD
jgi:DNA replication protein DnaC